MSEWIAIGEACPKLPDTEATIQRRKEVKHLIASNLIKARAFRPKMSTTEFERKDDLAIFAEVVRRGILDTCHFPFATKTRGKNADDLNEIGYVQLSGTPNETSSDWVSLGRDNFTITQTKADWELGHFHRRTLMYSSPGWGFEDDIGFVYMESDAYAVEIEATALNRLLGLRVSLPAEQQTTRYDWEAAFADVAARFYHDVQFENIEARGVQAEIERMLIASFEKRGVAIPSPETCKPKARKLLGALRGEKPK